VGFTTNFDFSLTNDSSPQSVAAGQTALYDLNVQPLGSTFVDPVTFSCSGLPEQSTCSFNPPRIAAGHGDTSVTLTITSAAPVLGSVVLPNPPLLVYALWLVVPGLMLPGPPRNRRRIRRRRASILLLLVAVALTMAGCGGGASSATGSGEPGTNPGTYTVTVIAVSGSLNRSTPVTLTVN
jgi:hypothetical protein